MPTYTVDVGAGNGRRKICVTIPDAKQEECPMSIILRMPSISTLVSDIIIANDIQASTGAVMFGMDPRKWPIRWFDGMRLAHSMEKEIDSAIDTTVSGLT